MTSAPKKLELTEIVRCAIAAQMGKSGPIASSLVAGAALEAVISAGFDICEQTEVIDDLYRVHDIIRGAIWGGEGSESSATAVIEALEAQGFRITKVKL